MLMDGFIFMVIGMTVVFVFLIIMVLLMRGVAFFMKFLPAEAPSLPAAKKEIRNAGLEEIAIAVAIAKKSMKK
jgi:sodium pump decarboxylase gamma subunit